MFRFFAGVAAVTFVLPSVATSQTATESATQLHWKFTSGEKYKVEIKQDLSQEITIHGTPVATKNKTTTWATWAVNEVDPSGTASITSTIDRMQMDLDIPMVGKIKIDTSNTEAQEGMAEQFAASLRPMIGKEIKQTMNARGAVTDIQIPESMFAGFQAAPAGGFMMTDKQMAAMIENASPVFPAEAIEPGKSWSQSSINDSPIGKMTIDTEFKYQGSVTLDGDEVQRVETRAQMDFPDGPAGIEISVADQSIVGELFFSVAEGKLVKSTVNQDMTMNIAAGNQEMVQHLSQVIEATFTRE